MNEPSRLIDINVHLLSNYLSPIISEKAIFIEELTGISARLGNLLLKGLIICTKKASPSSIANDNFLSLFHKSDLRRCLKSDVLIQLTEVDFRSCAFINDHSISKHLLSHALIETIDLRDCNVTHHVFNLLTKYFPRLTNLYLGRTESKLEPHESIQEFFPQHNCNPNYSLRKSNLKLLSLEAILRVSDRNESAAAIFIQSLIHSSKQIRQLDLSRNIAIDNLNFIDCFKTIHSLILYDIQPKAIETSIDAICSLKTLVLLDLSYNRRNQDAPNYSNPTLTLAKIARNLPKLLSLDISGTNLAGSYSFDRDEEILYYKKTFFIDDDENFTVESSISGLLLLKNRLEFLGLFDTEERASARPFLPAKRITGEYSEEMLVTSLCQYSERPNMLTHIMAHLFRLYNHYTIQNPLDAGKLVMDSMEKHPYDRSLQTSGSACLYYVVDMFQNEPHTVLEKHQDYLKRLLLAILRAMTIHINHSPMIRNGLLTISRMQMHLPNHIMSAFEKTVEVLLQFIKLYMNDHVVHDQTLLHNALSVLNHIACSVDGQEKLFIGRACAIETAMGIIQCFLAKNVSNDIADIAWTLLWNITDETPENCRRFIEDNNGLQAFLSCLNTWPDRRDLVRNMLGLLGNVAEVKELRSHLVTVDLVEKFRTLLQRSEENDIEIPYNCGGILANILSDGRDAWKINSFVEIDVVDKEMYDAIQTWDLRRPRTINYRSLAPILRLLNDQYPTGCIMWAVWAMTNLTTVLPEKYCILVRNEKGEPLLNQILHNDELSESIRNLAAAALDNVQKFYDPSTSMEVDESDQLQEA